MRPEWTGSLATPYPGTGRSVCNTANRPANEPSLAEMTTKAIDLLDNGHPKGSAWGHGGRKGFFLQVEGASIDKQDHAENPCGQIGETVEFDRAIQVGLDCAKHASRHADHRHGRPRPHQPDHRVPQTATDHSPGAISTLITADGAPMVVNYATNISGRSQNHTGTEVRVAAQGPQAANVVGVIDQTDLFHTMARALGLE